MQCFAGFPDSRRFVPILGLVLLLTLALGQAAQAGSSAKAGPYQVEVTTDPAVIPVGRVTMIVKVTDAGDKPVESATVRVFVEMPGMKMGEREETAVAQPGQPGVYRAPAQFAMAGAYQATVTVKGPSGEAKAVINLSTGTSTGSGATGFPWLTVAGILILLGAVVFVLARMRSTGQRVDIRALCNRTVIGWFLLIAVIVAVSVVAVQTLRRPGAMTPIEGQAMEMNMPAPVGAVPVELATVRQGALDETVRYSGQAVGFVEQDAVARVQGVIIEMPVYVGTRVRQGHLLARLDTSQLEPQLAERRAAVRMARDQQQVAVAEVQQAQQQVHVAHTEVGMQQGEVDAARAGVAAARTQVTDARAGLRSAQASHAYWREQLKRSQALVAQQVVSREEYQKDQASAADAEAKEQQARARLAQAEAQVRMAEAGFRKARVGVTSHEAHVGATEAGVTSNQRKVGAAEAAVAQAQAAYDAALAQRGYAEIRAQVDGVVTQRLISPGVLVNPGQAILRVAQTRPIRLQASVAATDLARIRVGNAVRVSTQEKGAKPMLARVTSVQPAMDAAARTGIVEAVVPNLDQRFLPGAYVVMDITVAHASDVAMVPTRAIVQRSAWVSETDSKPSRAFVWVAEADSAGTLKARRVEVQVGASDDSHTAVRGELKAGQRVVVAGYEYLKEGDTVTTPSPSPSSSPQPTTKAATPTGDEPRAITVQVTERGFEPATVTLEKGKPARLTFIRRTDQTCGTEVVIPGLNQRKKLPLNQPVVLEITPVTAGEFKMTCPMDMLQGKVIVQ